MEYIDEKELLSISAAKYDRVVEIRGGWEGRHYENWCIYKNDYSDDFRKKCPDQARGYIPFMSDMVDRIGGILMESFLSRGKRFAEFKSTNGNNAYAMRELMMQELAQNNFDELLDDLTLEANVSGYCVLKGYWDGDEGRVKLHYVDPLDFYRLPDSHDDFLTIERKVVEAGDLAQFKGDERYVQETIEAILAGGLQMALPPCADANSGSAKDYTNDEYMKMRIQGMSAGRYNGLGKPVEVLEFWGRLYREDGTRVLREGDTDTIMTWQTAGGKLLKKPEPSWYYGGGKPYAFGYVKRVQNAPHPDSVLHDHAILQRSHTRIINNIADKLATHRTYMVYVKQLIDKAQLRRAVNTNDYIEQRAPGPDGLRAVTSQLVLDPEFQFLSGVERGMAPMGPSDVGMGIPTSRGTPTLGEVRDRLSSGMSFIGTIGRRLDRSFMQSLVKLIVINILQFKLNKDENPYYDTNVLGYLGEDTVMLSQDLLTADEARRKEMLKTEFSDVRIVGLSDILSREEKLSGINYMLRMVSQMAQSMPVITTDDGQQIPLTEAIDIPALIAAAADNTGFERTEILKPRFLKLLEMRKAGNPEMEPGAPILPPQGAMGAPPGALGGGMGMEETGGMYD
jgi:hypothetical protein